MTKPREARAEREGESQNERKIIKTTLLDLKRREPKATKEGERPDKEPRGVRRPAGSGGPSPLGFRP
eukprot:3055169-Pyramimonas_sp.AAC.1